MKLKNAFGVTSIISTFQESKTSFKTFGGSSLDRKKDERKKEKNQKKKKEKKQDKLYSMSSRTKSKIKGKIIAFFQLCKSLTFVTLTFANEIDDMKAVKILRSFIDNVKKQHEKFDYLWVAERQSKNNVFKDNIHFHLITNIYWDIDKYWKYWLSLQNKNGIIPRDKNYKPSSAFDVKFIQKEEVKKIMNYLTKYVTKNKAEFKCQVWNCSKGISRLYTCFYSKYDNFIKQIEKIVDKPLKWSESEYYKSCFIPLNEKTINKYNCIKEKNEKVSV
jgi:hypothetical protein